MEAQIALITAVFSLLVTLIQECRRSRCTEIDVGDWIHIRRKVDGGGTRMETAQPPSIAANVPRIPERAGPSMV